MRAPLHLFFDPFIYGRLGETDESSFLSPRTCIHYPNLVVPPLGFRSVHRLSFQSLLTLPARLEHHIAKCTIRLPSLSSLFPATSSHVFCLISLSLNTCIVTVCDASLVAFMFHW